MAAIIVFQQFPWKNDALRFHATKMFHATAGVFHRFDDVGRRLGRSVAVQQNINDDALPASFRKRLRQFMRDRAVFNEILREGDCGFGASDLAQHDGERSITVQ